MFDLVSDLHIEKTFDLFSDSIEKSFPFYIENQNNDYLIIAGDLSNDTSIIENFLKFISSKYKKIFYIFGNHEMHLNPIEFNKFSNSYEKLDLIKNFNIDNVIFLDGTTYKFENNLIIGGAMGWYDASYIFHYLNPYYTKSKNDILKLWYSFLDYRKIKGFDSFYDIFDIEIKKIKKISAEANIVVSHFMPLIKQSYIQDVFKYNDLTGFYTFDGEKFIFNDNIKSWIYGHTHDINGDFFIYDKDVINAFPFINKNKLFMKQLTKDMIF